MLFRPRARGCPRGPRLRSFALAFLLIFAVNLLACSHDRVGTQSRDDLRAEFSLRPMPTIPYPPDNPPLEERVALGRLLFFDPILSGPSDTACGTCHHPAFAWGDGRARAIGVGGEGIGPDRDYLEVDPIFPFLETARNSPTCMNAGCSSHEEDGTPHYEGLQFWDGRAAGLEAQSMLPIESFDEMRGFAYVPHDAMEQVILKLRAVPEYVELFRGAFPAEAAEMDAWPGVVARHVIQEGTYSRALGAYQRELLFLSSPFDAYVEGNDEALDDDEFEGLRLFFGKAGCGGCHNGPMLSNYEFTVTGVEQAGPGRDAAIRGGDGIDHGRWEHSDDEIDRYAFRVPTLRNVELTAPYFRTGETATLREVVEFYDDGGNSAGLEAWRMDPRIGPLGLSELEIDQLVAFLESLTDTTVDSPIVDLTVPQTVPSGLDPPEPSLAPFSRVP